MPKCYVVYYITGYDSEKNVDKVTLFKKCVRNILYLIQLQELGNQKYFLRKL